MLRSTRGYDDATETAGIERARDLPRGFPKKFGVLEGLAGDDNVRAFRRDFLPVVGIAQDEIDVRSGGKIDAYIFPRRQSKERAITAVIILAAKIENDQRLGATRIEIIAPERGHLVERALVHGVAVNAAGRFFATALSRSALLSPSKLQS